MSTAAAKNSIEFALGSIEQQEGLGWLKKSLSKALDELTSDKSSKQLSQILAAIHGANYEEAVGTDRAVQDALAFINSNKKI